MTVEGWTRLLDVLHYATWVIIAANAVWLVVSDYRHRKKMRQIEAHTEHLQRLTREFRHWGLRQFNPDLSDAERIAAGVQYQRAVDEWLEPKGEQKH